MCPRAAVRRATLSLVLAVGVAAGTAYPATGAPASARGAAQPPMVLTAASAPYLAAGDSGPAVRAWQQRVNAWRSANGLPAISVDGVFGPRTRAATEAVQSALGVAVDGVVGPHTRGAIGAPNETAPAANPTDGPTLSRGDTGHAVTTVQQRLSDLGYWLGPADGEFGALTQQAVYALQKAAGLTRDGVVGPHTRAALTAGVRPHAHSSDGHVIEIDRADQLLLVVDDGSVQKIFNTSTGTGRHYWSRGHRYVADTPPGHWHIYRQVDGWDYGPLGGLYRPKYFNEEGVAIHGEPAAEVPPHAVSHGCARVTLAAIDWLWDNGELPIGTAVWVY